MKERRKRQEEERGHNERLTYTLYRAPQGWGGVVAGADGREKMTGLCTVIRSKRQPAGCCGKRGARNP